MLDFLIFYNEFWLDWLLDLSFETLEDWADDLLVVLLCWLQMAWCWLYTTVLDLFVAVLEEVLPLLPEYVLNFALVLNYYDAADAWIPLTETVVLFSAYILFYIPVRIVYIAQPWAG